jgi:formate hydrogenlyase subunit 3/multisubunit Na+/H+ antiporter MnhD subunit
VLVVLLAIIFVGIAARILEMAYGVPPVPGGPRAAEHNEERAGLVIAPVVLAVLVLGLGVYLPQPLADALSSAAIVLGGRAP